MHSLLKHPLVDCDLEEAALWYHLRSAESAERLISETRLTMRLIAENPLHFPTRFKHYRRAKISAFPLSIYYVADKTEVYILAIVHGARDVPALLRERKLAV